MFEDAALLHLVPALGGALRHRFDPGAGGGSGDRGPTVLDDFEREVELAAVAGLAAGFGYGLGGHQMSWLASEESGPDRACWSTPGLRVEGECTLAPDLAGPTWYGRAHIAANVRVRVMPCPSLAIGPGRSLEVAGWSRARLPAISVAVGPERDIEIGGRVLASGELQLWYRDDGAEVVRLLTPPSVCAPAQARDDAARSLRRPAALAKGRSPA